jgi:hypothetical protein
MGEAAGLVSGGLGLAKSAAGGKGGGKGGGDSSGSGAGNEAQAEWQHMQDLNKIRSRYADLGLGGSTMESMDEAGAGLGFLAEQNQLQNQSQQTANSTLQAQTGALGSLTNLANQQGGQQAFGAGAASAGGGGGGNPAVST